MFLGILGESSAMLTERAGGMMMNGLSLLSVCFVDGACFEL